MIILTEEWLTFRDDLLVLFEESFDRKIERSFFDWRYFNNPRNKLLFSVDRMDEVLIASYSASPVMLSKSGVKALTALSMTTMTHPKARGKGLFPILATELYKEMDENDIGFVWGFPNTNSHRIFKNKLGWKDIYEIPTLMLTLDLSSSKKFTSNALVSRDDAFNLGYRPQEGDELIRVYKDNEYLKWRYLDNPINEYQCFVIHNEGDVGSYVIAKIYAHSIDLVDIQVKNEEECGVILSHIIRFFYDSGVTHFSCWAPVHHFVHDILERFGFVNTAPISYFAGKLLTDNFINNNWSDYSQWYIQMGDSDVY
jgi:hypothetical protein